MKKQGDKRYPDTVRYDIIALDSQGSNPTEIAKKVNCSRAMVYNVLQNKELYKTLPKNLFIQDYTQLRNLLYEALRKSLKPFKENGNSKKVLEDIKMTQEMDVRFRKADNVIAIQNMNVNVNISQLLIDALELIDRYQKGSVPFRRIENDE